MQFWATIQSLSCWTPPPSVPISTEFHIRCGGKWVRRWSSWGNCWQIRDFEEDGDMFGSKVWDMLGYKLVNFGVEAHRKMMTFFGGMLFGLNCLVFMARTRFGTNDPTDADVFVVPALIGSACLGGLYDTHCALKKAGIEDYWSWWNRYDYVWLCICHYHHAPVIIHHPCCLLFVVENRLQL